MSAVTNVCGYDRWARYVVLCQGKSGSGASLGACDAAWVRTCVGVPLSHCMSDRMFLPLGVDSHGRIASVQRRVNGLSVRFDARERGGTGRKTCTVLNRVGRIDLQDLNSVDGFRAWWLSR